MRKNSPLLESAAIAAVVSSVISSVPAVIATYRVGQMQVNAQLVSVAAQVLMSPGDTANKPAKEWARRVINEFSPVRLDSADVPMFSSIGKITWAPAGPCRPDGPAAVVNSSGVVTGCHPGIGTISATLNGTTTMTSVTVGMPIGATTKLGVWLKNAQGNPVPVTGP